MSLTRRGPQARGSRALLAGAVGGLCAGLSDAGAALLFGLGGLSRLRTVQFVALATGVGVLAGLGLAALVFGLAWMAGRGGRSRPGAAALASAAVGAPLLAYDAFALFAGAKAARIPGHQVLSVALLAVGVLGLAAAARVATGWIAAVEEPSPSSPVSPERGRRQALRGAVALLLVLLGAHVANRLFLPRLYRWFHVALALSALAAAVAGVRLLGPALTRRPSPRAPRALRIAAGVAALAVIAALATIPGFLHSAGLRATALEKAALTGLALGHIPLPARARPRPAVEESLTPAGPLPEGPHHPNADIVLITLDALRYDHVSAYGYGRPTTPNIDRLAREGVRFERVYAQAPHTSFSVASMLTGKYYPTLARLTPGDPHEPVTTVLRRYGWKTAAFYPPAVFYVDAEKLKAFKDTNFEFEYVKFEYLDAFERLGQIEEYFASVKPERAFVWLHLFEPHEPYDLRASYAFNGPDGKPDVSDIGRYDSEVAYADAAVGRVVAYLEKNRPGAIVIVSADHGEEFDEHGGRYHGSSLYEEQTRVPLVVWAPGLVPHVVAGPVELIDIAPTVLGLLDIPVPVRMRGTDLGPWLSAVPPPSSRLPPAFAELENDRMVVAGTDKLICQMLWGTCRYFDLATDPHERRDLAEQKPERAAMLKGKLDVWLDSHVRFEPQLARGLSNPQGEAIPHAIERGRLGDLGVVTVLAQMLRSREPLAVRREAARLLVSLPRRPETRTDVVAALDADDEEVRDWAAVAAMRLGHEPARPRLVALLARPVPGGEAAPDPLRVEAAMALGQVGDRTGVPVLAAKLDSCDSIPACRLIIIRLGLLRDARAVPALLRHVSEVQNRREMVDALGQIGDARALDVLIERLERDEYVPVRAAAAQALGAIGGAQAHAALERARRNETEALVNEAISTALNARARGDAGAIAAPPAVPKPHKGSGVLTASGVAPSRAPTPGTPGSPQPLPAPPPPELRKDGSP